MIRYNRWWKLYCWIIGVGMGLGGAGLDVSLGPLAASTLWTENGENGLTYVIDQTDPSYPLLQSDVVSQGTYAFHLANPKFQDNIQDNWFEIDQTISIETDTKLFFQSRLRTATSSQIAKVQISTDGGNTWPVDLFSQPGNGFPGQGIFGLQQVNLGGYANQSLRFRFMYDFVGGSAFTQTSTNVGWFIDDIQIADQLQKSEYSIGNPTVYEQAYLEYVNRARADALVEANRLANETDPDIVSSYSFFGINGQDIVDQFAWYIDQGHIERYAQPLSFNENLLQAAQLHTQDQFDNEFQGHVSSSNPPAPFLPGYELDDRLDAVGYSWIQVAENVFSHADSVAHGEAGFDVDWGNPENTSHFAYNPDFVGQGMQNPAGHRLNIHNNDFKEAGMGVINGTNGSVGPQLITQEFGNSGAATFITGVVFDDLNGNAFYDVGEGRSGVRIDVTGSGFFAISSASGGYSVPVVGDGQFDVAFTGGGFADLFTTATALGGENVKVDYMVVAQTLLAADFNEDGAVDSDDLAIWQATLGLNAIGDTDDDQDTDGADLLTWQRQYTGSPAATSSSISVPEPESWLLLGMACLYGGWRRHQK
jgi:hypothetical protein